MSCQSRVICVGCVGMLAKPARCDTGPITRSKSQRMEEQISLSIMMIQEVESPQNLKIIACGSLLEYNCEFYVRWANISH